MPTAVEAKARQIENHFSELLQMAKCAGLGSIILPFGTFSDQDEVKVRGLIASYASSKGHKSKCFLHQTHLYLEIYV